MTRWLILTVGLLVSTPAAAKPLRMKMEHPKAEPWTLRWFGDLLTGIEASYSLGESSISSSVRPVDGPSFRVASGRVRTRGFGASLMTAPRETNVGITADLGFFNQVAEVYGFKQSLPRPARSTDVPGSCSSATTGEYVDCTEPNRYNISVWSGYLGPKAWAAAVAANDGVELWALVGIAARAFELRSVRVEIANSEASRLAPTFFRSAIGSATIGLSFPKLHAGFRVGFDYEHYLRFKYPKELEFQGPVTYDEEQDIWLRPRMFVEDAQIGSWTFTMAAGLLF